MDEQRELLDQLMGINRNNDRSHNEVSDYRDDRVCKMFLRGLCPHDMFVNTKCDEGPCKKLHSAPVKMCFESSDDIYIYDMMIEKDLRARVADIDRTVRRQYDRLETEKDQGSAYERNEDYIQLTVEIVRTGDAAEAAAESDDIDRAQELMLRVDALMKQREDLKSGLLETFKLTHKSLADTSKKLRVCDVCGSLLSILDSDKRLADHFMGKQHIGFQTMRDALAAIEERRKTGVYDRVNFITGSGNGGGGGGGRRSRSRSGSRDGGRRDRSRDRRQRSGSRNRQRNQRRDSRDRGNNYRGGGGGGGGGGRDRNISGGGGGGGRDSDVYGGGGRSRGSRW